MAAKRTRWEKDPYRVIRVTRPKGTVAIDVRAIARELARASTFPDIENLYYVIARNTTTERA